MELENINQDQNNNEGSITQENISSPETIRYAGFWIRAWANFLDGLVLMIPSILIRISFSLIMPEMIEKMVAPVLGMAVSWGYFIYMTDKYQATLGKKWCGLKVVAENQEKLNITQIILRETVGKLVSAFILLIGYIMVAFTEKKQGLHDKLAGSVVIRIS